MRSEMITEYIAYDGTRFRSPDACKAYEIELTEVDAVMSRLPIVERIPHGEYFQHDAKVLCNAKCELFKLVLKKYGDEYPIWKTWNVQDVHPLCGIGRCLDGDNSPTAKAWSRLSVYNFDNGRQYDQSYFALNPNEAKEMNK